MGNALVAGFVSAVRGAVGLPNDRGTPPDLLRLGLYRANVDACASDGSTLDVTPEDKRISPEKHVRVCVGIPGAQAVMVPGAVVLLGWERGDPSRPYAVPHWESGASVTKLIFNAQLIQLVSGSSAQSAVRGTVYRAAEDALFTALASGLSAAAAALATAGADPTLVALAPLAATALATAGGALGSTVASAFSAFSGGATGYVTSAVKTP